MSSRSDIVGRAPQLLAALDEAARFAPTDMPVLIVGETGTGKELFARHVHELSKRDGPLVDVDCGAIPDDLIESVLFGHRRGAFTGAVEHADGIVVRADRGTLFLDELASLPPRGQAKLLRVLETGRVRRVGGGRARKVDFRLVATIQGQVAEKMKAGMFRLDLIQRVAGVVIHLPPLAERPEDVVPLARHFARSVGATLTEGAEGLLEARHWPGNIRELRWAVLRAAMVEEGTEVTETAMKEALESGPATLLDGNAGRASEATKLRAACREHDGDAEQVAASLGIGKSTLYRRLRQFGLELRAFRRRGPVVS